MSETIIRNISSSPLCVTPGYENIEAVRQLFSEYVTWLGLDLSFQHFDEELRNLPGKYVMPDGGLYLGWQGEALAGCVAFRRFDATRCEMKRLFVREPYRGSGLGRLLAERAIEDAMRSGYGSMVLDTMDSMRSALNLYNALDFKEIEPYYENPFPGVVYLEKTFR